MFSAPLDRSRLDISSNCSFKLLHSLRARHNVVLIGINTLAFDSPRLNVRDPLPGIDIPVQQPRPVVIDRDLKLLDVPIIHLSCPIVFTCEKEDSAKWQAAEAVLNKLGGNLVRCERTTDDRLHFRLKSFAYIELSIQYMQ